VSAVPRSNAAVAGFSTARPRLAGAAPRLV